MKSILHKNYGTIVKISSVPGFKDFLKDKTVPIIADAENPYDWAYMGDYIRFTKKFPPESLY